MTEPKLTRQEVMREIRNIQVFNYTLAPDEVFRTAIRAVQLAPDELFKNDRPLDTSERGVGGSVENIITQDDKSAFPTVERPHGKWIFKHNSADIWCSNCDENFDEMPQKFLFCPNCGADMSANDKQVTGKLNSEIEKSKSEIVPDYRDGWRLKEGDSDA